MSSERLTIVVPGDDPPQIAGSPHLADVTAVAVDEAGRLPTGGTGFLLLESPTPGRLTPHPLGSEAPVFPEQSSTEGLLGAAHAGDPEIVNDVAADPRATPGDRVAASLIVAPLKVEGSRLGVIGTASKEPVLFQAGDLKILTAIAALTAPFISQAHRYESATRGDE